MPAGSPGNGNWFRAVICDGMDFAHLAFALDRLLRALGGTTKSWRTDRMAAIVDTVSGRLLPARAELAKHYGVTVAVCPKNRPQRKGVVEAAVRYSRRSWWRTAQVATAAEAQASLDRWAVEVADRRRCRGRTVAALAEAEPLLPLPPQPYPAVLEVERVVSSSALVAFEGNRYSVPPAHVGERAMVVCRLGEPTLRIVSAAGVLVATHRRLPVGAGQTVRDDQHQQALERAVLAAFTTRKPCRGKTNRPPSSEALALARRLAPQAAVEVELPSLEHYAELAAAR